MLNISKITAVAAFFVLPAMATAVEDSGRWELKEKGVIVDTFSGLQWIQRDNLSPISGGEAKAYCDSLPLAGGGWRLPTYNELSQLYTGGRDGTTQCGDYICKVSPKFYLTDFHFQCDKKDDVACSRNLADISENEMNEKIYGHLLSHTRALCVRRHF